MGIPVKVVPKAESFYDNYDKIFGQRKERQKTNEELLWEKLDEMRTHIKDGNISVLENYLVKSFEEIQQYRRSSK